MPSQSLRYVIDEEDRLVKIDAGFYRFAAENGWTGAEASLGRPLWDFVAGDQLTTLLRILVRRVRDGAGSVELPFRCDGPDVRREMNIRITPTSTGRAVLFATNVRSEEAREFQPLLEPETDRVEELIEMCGWCDRFQVEGNWVEVEEAATRLRLYQRSEAPTISHSICRDCARKLLG